MRTVHSIDDKLERLLVSFKDAKVRRTSLSNARSSLYLAYQIALLEWSDAIHDVITVSIHTYERAPQLVSTAYFRGLCLVLVSWVGVPFSSAPSEVCGAEAG